jgi:hypothetical protein
VNTFGRQRAGHGFGRLRTRAVLFAMLVALTLLAARDCPAQQSASQDSATTNNPNPPPLTGRERWDRYLDETYLSPGPYIVSLGTGLALQAFDYPSEWGGGFAGFGRRAGNQFGIIVLQDSIHDGGEAVFHYDPRYFPCHCSGFWRRAGHAVEMSFLTYDQNGHKQLDVTQIAGAYGSGMISALWGPRRFSPWVQGVQTGHMQFGFVMGTNLFDEFKPEVRRVKLFRKFISADNP